MLAELDPLATDKLYIKFPETILAPVLPMKNRPTIPPIYEDKVLDKLYIVFPVTVLRVTHDNAMPQTEALPFCASLPFAIVRSLIILPEIAFVPLAETIPLMRARLVGNELDAPLVRFAIVLLPIVMDPVPALLIPITVWP